MATDNPYRGKCYQTTFEMMQSPNHPDLVKIIDILHLDPFLPDEHLILCHGMARMKSGKIEGHAWIEIVKQVVYDPATDHLEPYEINDFLKEFECSQIRRFSRSEVVILSHYGKFPVPWNDLTEADIREAGSCDSGT